MSKHILTKTRIDQAFKQGQRPLHNRPLILTTVPRQSVWPAVESMERVSEAQAVLLRCVTRTLYDHYFVRRDGDMPHDIKELWATSDDVSAENDKAVMYMLPLPFWIPEPGDTVELREDAPDLGVGALRMIQISSANDGGFVSSTATTECLREALYGRFPGHKFRIRCHRRRPAEGHRINVHWLDGPTKAGVEEIVEYFVGRGTPNPLGQRSYIRCLLDGRQVQFDSGSAVLTRDYTEEAILPVAQAVCAEYDAPLPVFKEWDSGGVYLTDPTVTVIRDNKGVHSIPELIFERLETMSLYSQKNSDEIDLRGAFRRVKIGSKSYTYHVDRGWTWLTFNVSPNQKVIDRLNVAGALWSDRRRRFYFTRQVAWEEIEGIIQVAQ